MCVYSSVWAEEEHAQHRLLLPSPFRGASEQEQEQWQDVDRATGPTNVPTRVQALPQLASGTASRALRGICPNCCKGDAAWGKGHQRKRAGLTGS